MSLMRPTGRRNSLLKHKLLKPKRFGLNATNTSVDQSLNTSNSMNTTHIRKGSNGSDSMIIKRMDSEEDMHVRKIDAGADDSQLDPNTSMCSLASDVSDGGVVVVKHNAADESQD